VMLGVRLTVVGNEIEAETICGLLRTEGIACDHRQTDMGAGAWEATGSGGPREILVEAGDLERARELIKPDTSFETTTGTSDTETPDTTPSGSE
jgi:hypothetical protein